LPCTHRGLAARSQRRLQRLAPRLELIGLGRERVGLPAQLLELLPIEFDLLLPATDRQLARVRLVARRGGARLGRSQLEPHGFNRALELGHARGCRNLARTCRLETRLGAGNGRAQRLVAPRDLHLLPLPQLFAELPVPPRTRRLALQ